MKLQCSENNIQLLCLAYTRARARSLVALDAGSDALDARRPAAHLLAALAEQLVAIVRYLG